MKQYYQGTVIYFSADNLGAQFIGGYKEGSQAHRKCRDCMGSEEEIQNFVSQNFVMVVANYFSIYVLIS